MDTITIISLVTGANLLAMLALHSYHMDKAEKAQERIRELESLALLQKKYIEDKDRRDFANRAIAESGNKAGLTPVTDGERTEINKIYASNVDKTPSSKQAHANITMKDIETALDATGAKDNYTFAVHPEQAQYLAKVKAKRAAKLAAAKKWREKNKEHVRQYAKDYHQAKKVEKAKKHGKKKA